MSNAVDHFSSTSKEYSFSRPTYPDILYKYLDDITPGKDKAWDCATGNGQAAVGLCKYFKNVIASDASKEQLAYRFPRSNIHYEMFPAERANLEDGSIDLITVAQAAHWFDLDKFYKEVTRVSKNNGILAIWSYGMHKIDNHIDTISAKLNVGGDILGKYWPKETIYVKEDYKTISFPFKEIMTPKFEMTVNWNLDELVSYMQTWSAVKRFSVEKKFNPIDLIMTDLEKLWGKRENKKLVKWDINIRIGAVHVS
ncbi:class I SAM-dependent methyltransferase [Candidatus Nitrosocosmicus franklandus]|uniref:Methyltransferase domain protein n=1 Tax=Candidatus Nitrosocosmicus franklandianus TaxID=1798806 RepID=A0A484I8J8_9ARCH|nr:class I SAM-dependent methyltransferase [Candidatus Nitrosocosmicus franklandus]VFJ13436.1 Methyltransferase domain protein [Candidatus Nitrosocosmicus franklandus]